MTWLNSLLYIALIAFNTGVIWLTRATFVLFGWNDILAWIVAYCIILPITALSIRNLEK